MFVPLFAVVSRRISMPLTCSSCRKYGELPWTMDIVHWATRRTNLILRSCREANQDFFNGGNFRSNSFASTQPILQVQRRWHKHTLYMQANSKKFKFLDCLGFSGLFKQYRCQSTKQYFTNPHSQNSKTERSKCGRFGVVLKMVQVPCAFKFSITNTNSTEHSSISQLQNIQN